MKIIVAIGGGDIRTLATEPIDRAIIELSGRAPPNVLFVPTADSRAELARRFPAIVRHLAPGGMVWISWPKKSSPLAGDLTEDGVRAVGLRTEFVDVKVCAVDHDWSGLKFMRRRRRPHR